MASSIWADLCCRESIISNSSRHHPCFYLVLQNNNLLNQQTLSPADFRRILKLSQSMSSGILETRSQLSSWQLQQSLTGQHCPQPMKFTLSIWIYCNIAWYLPEKCIDWGSLRSGQFSLLQKSNLHPAQQLILKIIIFIPKFVNFYHLLNRAQNPAGVPSILKSRLWSRQLWPKKILLNSNWTHWPTTKYHN